MIQIAKRLGIFALMIGVMTACSGGSDQPNSPTTSANEISAATPLPVPTVPPDAQPALPLNDTGVQLVAEVNGTEITLPDFERTFMRSQQVTDVAGYDAAVSVVLNMLIEQILINQQAQEMGIVISDAEVNTQYQETRAMIPEDGVWQQWLADNLFTEEELRESLRITLLTQRVQSQVVDATNVTVPLIHARHILVADVETANLVLARLDAGEDFAQLAAELSNDTTTRNAGGDLGWFDRDDFDLTAPELAAFAGQLQPGERGGPITTMLGYHIVETIAFGQRPANPEEQYNAAVEQFDNWLSALRVNAVVERYIQ